jgi:hypothetical protein
MTDNATNGGSGGDHAADMTNGVPEARGGGEQGADLTNPTNGVPEACDGGGGGQISGGDEPVKKKTLLPTPTPHLLIPVGEEFSGDRLVRSFHAL